MSQLTDIHRRCDVAEADAKAEYESSSEEHPVSLCGSSHAGAEDNDQRARKQGCTSTKPVI
jgi:hypothetical protein